MWPNILLIFAADNENSLQKKKKKTRLDRETPMHRDRLTAYNEHSDDLNVSLESLARILCSEHTETG